MKKSTTLKRHLDIELLNDIIRKLANDEQLPEKNKNHALVGNWTGHRKCNILPDWLLVYRIENDLLILALRRWTKGYRIKQPNMDCQPTEITALMRHRAVFS